MTLHAALSIVSTGVLLIGSTGVWGQANADPVVSEESFSEDTSTLDETVIESSSTQGVESELIADEAPNILKTDAPLLEIPRSVSVITRQQLEDRGSRTVQDALLYTPGVYGETYGFDTRGDWALVRGVAPEAYVDGLRSLFSFYNNTRPHPYALSSIEILKGPASVLYGQSSLGGILNASSKLPLSLPYNEAYLSYGSHDRVEGGLDIGGQFEDGGRVSWRLTGALRDSQTQVDYVRDDTWFISPSVTWEPTDDTAITILATFQEAETGTSAVFVPWEGTVLPGRKIPTDRFLSEPDFDRYDTEQQSFTAIVEHRIDEVFSMEARARYSDSAADYRSIWPAFPPAIQEDGTIDRTLYLSDATSESFVADARGRAEFGTGPLSHDATLGFDYQHAVTDNDFFYSYLGGGPINIYNPVYGQPLDIGPITDYPSTTFEQRGIYFSDRVEWGDNWLATFGARYDELTSETGGTDQDDDAFMFNGGLMYRTDVGVNPYVSYAESFLPVPGTDLDNEPYRPREGRQYEAGIKYQPPGTNSLFTVAYFDIEERNRLTASPDGVGSVQTGEVGIRGFEFEAMTRIQDFYFQLGYSYIDAEITSSNDGNEGFHVASVPEHQFMTWVTWAPSGFWQGFKAGVGLRYVGESWDGADTVRTPSYTLIDAMAGYEKGPWEFTINATNLADKEYVTTALARGDAFFGQRRFIGATLRCRF